MAVEIQTQNFGRTLAVFYLGSKNSKKPLSNSKLLSQPTKPTMFICYHFLRYGYNCCGSTHSIVYCFLSSAKSQFKNIGCIKEDKKSK